VAALASASSRPPPPSAPTHSRVDDFAPLGCGQLPPGLLHRRVDCTMGKQEYKWTDKGAWRRAGAITGKARRRGVAAGVGAAPMVAS